MEPHGMTIIMDESGFPIGQTPSVICMDNPPLPEPIRNTDRQNVGSEYDAEAVALLKAMDRFKRERQVPFPTFVDVLNVLKSLGYRKVEAT
jgi:hypothetical protein